MRVKLELVMLCAAVALSGCTRPPETVYVEGPGFREELLVLSSRGDTARLGVGEPLVLSASRRSGPWEAAPYASLPPRACWLEARPAELEAQVAGSVHWIVTPEGSAEFNVELRTDGTREVRFSKPGRYEVVAESASACGEPFRGGPIVVDVVGAP